MRMRWKLSYDAFVWLPILAVRMALRSSKEDENRLHQPGTGLIGSVFDRAGGLESPPAGTIACHTRVQREL
jgi:hypothetical protein